MLEQFHNYEKPELIHETRSSLIYSSVAKIDGAKVIIKACKDEHPNADLLAQYRNELKLIQLIDSPYVIKAYDLVQSGAHLALILENISGKSLKEQFCSGQKAPLETVYEIARKIALALEAIHLKSIVHKDINASNIVYNSLSKSLKVIDFGISSKQEEIEERNENSDLEGTLQYISPEQTGRMNLTVDFRSDFYSFGIVLYELATGQLPFQSHDPKELVHFHIAKVPKLANDLVINVPYSLAQIIDKLLQKSPDQRYQSIAGVIFDLDQSYRLYKSSQRNQPIQIGKADNHHDFILSQRLYGREVQLEQIQDAYHEVALGGCKVFFLNGRAGIGKTSIVKEVLKPLSKEQGIFIDGKFDQYRSSIPYFALSQALKKLARQISLYDELTLEKIKSEFAKSVGQNASLLTPIVPELEFLANNAKSNIEKGSERAAHRILNTFVSFFQIFFNANSPLVLYIDDLQWADPATLKVLAALLQSKPKNLMLILSYRYEDLNLNLPAKNFLDDYEKQDFSQICQIEPLTFDNTYELIKDSFFNQENSFEILAKITFDKTGGNPFYISEFLRKLHDDHILFFAKDQNRWQIDLNRVATMQDYRDVVEFMVHKLQALSDRDLRILSNAAVIGNNFDLESLTYVIDAEKIDILSSLQQALKSGLIVTTSNDLRLLNLTINDNQLDAFNPQFKFRHDRVQQAAYSLILKDDQYNTHYKLAKWKLKSLNRKEKRVQIVEIVKHYNSCDLGNLSQRERRYLAYLNYFAASSAFKSIACDSSVQFLETARTISNNNWEKSYRLNWAIHFLLSESYFLVGNESKATSTYKLVLAASKTKFEKAKILIMTSINARQSGKLDDSLDILLQALTYLGIHLKRQPNLLLTIFKFAIAMGKTFRLGPKKLLRTKDAKEPWVNLLNDSLYMIASLAYLTGNKTLYLMAIAESLKSNIKNGLTEASSAAYAALAVFLSSMLRFKKSNDYMQLALQLADRFSNKALRGSIIFLNGLFIQSWKKPGHELGKYFKDAIDDCYQSGERFFLSHTIADRHVADYTLNLDEIVHLQGENMETLKIAKNIVVETQASSYYNFARFLNGTIEKDHPFTLFSNFEDQDTRLLKENRYFTGLAIYYLYKMKCCFFAKNYALAYEYSKIIYKNIDSIFSLRWLSEFLLYSHLTHLLVIKEKGFIERTLIAGKMMIEKYCFQKWYHNCPDQFAPQHYLLKALNASRNKKTAHNFGTHIESALTEAKKLNYPELIILINEQACIYYTNQRNDTIGSFFAREQLYWQTRWGVKSLNKGLGISQEINNFPRVKNNSTTTNFAAIDNTIAKANRILPEDFSNSSPYATVKTTKGFSQQLDFETLLSATQSIALEIDNDSLLKKILDLTLQNSGAQKAIIFSENNGHFIIAALRDIERQSTDLQKIPIPDLIPESLMLSVIRTKKGIVLNDAIKDPNFSSDPYIVKHQSHSILFFPMICKGRINGLIYLENQLLKDAFSDSRLRILEALISQASIAIENAKLIGNIRANERLKIELETAETVQECLLPESATLSAISIATYYRAASSIGGDWYHHYHHTLSNTIYLFCGDVTGHGISSALITGIVYGAISMSFYLENDARNMPNQEQMLKSIANNVNKIIVETGTKVGRGMTMLLMALDLNSGELNYINAGHNFAYHIQGHPSKVLGLLGSQNPFGVANSDSYAVYKTQLAAGDRLFLYTDGLFENRSSITGKPLGKRKFFKFLHDVREFSSMAEKIKEEITDNFKDELDDDITYFVLQWNPESGSKNREDLISIGAA